MKRTMTDLVGRTAEIDLTIFYFHCNITVDGLFQFTLRAFYAHHVVVTHRYCYTIGKFDGRFTYTRHNLNFLVSIFCFPFQPVSLLGIGLMYWKKASSHEL